MTSRLEAAATIFSRTRAPPQPSPTFDQVQVRINLVGTVHRQVEREHVVERRQRNTELPREARGRF
jgi:hypothetical protein